MLDFVVNVLRNYPGGKKVIRIFIASILGLIFLLAMPVFSFGADTGEIDGSLINSTAGSSSDVSKLTIILQTYKGNAAIGETSTLSDQNGKFSFGGLSTDSTYIYVIKVVFQGIDYYGEPITFNTDENLKSVQVKVYDTTSDDRAISIDMTHIILNIVDKILIVKENYLFLNNSDLTYIGLPLKGSTTERETLIFTVPIEVNVVSGSVGLMPASVRVQNGLFSDTSAVTPDGTFVSYSYQLSLSEDQKTLSWKINYDTGRFDLLLEKQNIKVSGEKLTQEAPLTINGKTYDHYSSLDLKKGDTITARLSGLLINPGQSSLVWIWFVFIPIALVVIIFLIIKLKQNARKSIRGNGIVDTNEERLMLDIADLDNSYEEGNINQNEYLKIRKEKKQQLIDLYREKSKGG
jgi:hypothetical protein